jgi:hypothetical protein
MRVKDKFSTKLDTRICLKKFMEVAQRDAKMMGNERSPSLAILLTIKMNRNTITKIIKGADNMNPLSMKVHNKHTLIALKTTNRIS